MIVEWAKLVSELGFPIASVLGLGGFIYFIVKYLLNSMIAKLDGMIAIQNRLHERIRNINNDLIRLDMLMSVALRIPPELERISRADEDDHRKD